ncbi:MAG: hypothetical protein JXB85_15950 [Anaerolineales bacterium]|nr:hypothetical protein [Anaerolineales bacterium]
MVITASVTSYPNSIPGKQRRYSSGYVFILQECDRLDEILRRTAGPHLLDEISQQGQTGIVGQVQEQQQALADGWILAGNQDQLNESIVISSRSGRFQSNLARS